MTTIRRRRALTAAVAAAGAIGIVTGGAAHGTGAVARPFLTEVPQTVGLHTPPSTQDCLALYGWHCYNPAQMTAAYNLAPLHNRGIDGRGYTILIVDSFGSPTIASDLHAFDQQFGLADPPSLTIRQDAGPVPPFDPTNSDMTSWAAETTLDVEWSHVFAPGANIVLEETPVSETEGVQGFPEIVKAETYAIDHGLADVISQSFGATEETFPSAQSILNLRGSFTEAKRKHVTVLGASGDLGATDYQFNASDIYTTRVNSWPSSDPLVTSIGGTQLLLANDGSRQAPDVVWNDGVGSGGGGVSAIFSRPDFQEKVKNVVGTQRGTPDISLSGACDGAVVYYHSYLPSDAQSRRGPWHIVCGTSEASPEFAGIVAMADQVAGKPLGNINKALYELGKKDSAGDEIVDVTSGDNSFGPFTNSDGNTYTVHGYNATVGYDLASGLGTLDAANFVPALAKHGQDDEHGGANNAHS